MQNEQKLTIGACILQALDGITTYVALETSLGYEANSFLASYAPITILSIKMLYAVILYSVYMWIVWKNEYLNYFNICIKLNIVIYSIVVMNNLGVLIL